MEKQAEQTETTTAASAGKSVASDEIACLRGELDEMRAKLAVSDQNCRLLLECSGTGGDVALENYELQEILRSKSWRLASRLHASSQKLGRACRLPKKFLQAWQKAGWRFALQKTLNKVLPSFRPAIFWSSQKREAQRGVYEEEEIVPVRETVRLIAFYLPQFHTFPENDRWWGKGFTEWTNVRRARPLFNNHYQPQEPLEGYYSLENPEVLRRQAELARRHGIHGFCFHHYYFSGKRLMEKPVDLFLAHPEIDIKFCLNWANENWTRRWDGQENEVLIAQKHSPADDIKFWEDVNRYFKDPRYIRVDGRPLFMIYHAALFPDMRATLWRWRKWCVERGEIIPYFVLAQSFYNYDPGEYGFDAAVQFPPHNSAFIGPDYERDYDIEGLAKNFAGDICDYEKMSRFWLSRLSRKFVNFPGVFPAWDNTPRRGPRSRLFFGSTPQKYEKWLSGALKYAKTELPRESQFVFVNAWNEWGEGAYLEPDKNYGYAYLNATARALNNYLWAGADRTPADASAGPAGESVPHKARQKPKALFIGHDAGLSGAPKVLFNILRWLRENTGVDARLVTFNEGPLSRAYASLFPTMVCPPDMANMEELEKFCGGKPDVVFGNTVVAAEMYPRLENWRAPFVTYVHELEMSLQKYATRQTIECMLEKSSLVIGASAAICENLQRNHGAPAALCRVAEAFIEPFAPVQGDDARALKKKLGLPENKILVLGCGTRSHRKGFDLFLRAAHLTTKICGNVHFCWLGGWENTRETIGLDLMACCANLSLPGEVRETEPWFQAADMFLLSSREDPFPLAALEAASCALPIICLAGSGGIPEFVGADAGMVVEDAQGMTAACARLAKNGDLRQKLGRKARERQIGRYSTDARLPYIWGLVESVAQAELFRNVAANSGKICHF